MFIYCFINHFRILLIVLLENALFWRQHARNLSAYFRGQTTSVGIWNHKIGFCYDFYEQVSVLVWSEAVTGLWRPCITFSFLFFSIFTVYLYLGNKIPNISNYNNSIDLEIFCEHRRQYVVSCVQRRQHKSVFLNWSRWVCPWMVSFSQTSRAENNSLTPQKTWQISQ